MRTPQKSFIKPNLSANEIHLILRPRNWRLLFISLKIVGNATHTDLISSRPHDDQPPVETMWIT
jgi:hypothetical protein